MDIHNVLKTLRSWLDFAKAQNSQTAHSEKTEQKTKLSPIETVARWAKAHPNTLCLVHTKCETHEKLSDMATLLATLVRGPRDEFGQVVFETSRKDTNTYIEITFNNGARVRLFRKT